MNAPALFLRPAAVYACATCLMLTLGSSLGASEPKLAGDTIPTDDGDLVVHPVNHASLLLGWKDSVIYVDPVGGAARYEGLPTPTIVLITHLHGDHLDPATIQALAKANTLFAAPPAVAEKLPSDLRARLTVLTNGASTTLGGVKIEATPAYNVTPERLQFHAKGRGNGYILTLGGKRVYLSGDTEDIPEMRALRGIEVAFVCMNLPYTMTPQQAADAIRAFRPKVVYPYHYRGSDLEKLKSLLAGEKGIDLRLRDWYAK